MSVHKRRIKKYETADYIETGIADPSGACAVAGDCVLDEGRE
jgi:hypothetical protein